MKERALQFGDKRRLAGILTMPDAPRPGLPAILIPNTGVEHRVGPNRLHVEWARTIAREGHVVLRLDLSGMGDSRLPAGGVDSDSVRDQQTALDELQRLGFGDRFIVIGLCSGGHEAHLLSMADPRIVGGVYTDHYAYRTPRFRRNYWAHRLFDVARIGRYLARKLRSLTGSAKERFRADMQEYFVQPTQARLCEDFQVFMDRRMSLFLLYTGELQSSDYNYRDQILDACPNLRGYPRLSLHYLENCDHTFSRLEMRAEMIGLLLEWLRSDHVRCNSTA